MPRIGATLRQNGNATSIRRNIITASATSMRGSSPSASVPTARLWLIGGKSLSRDDQVVTYSARNLEPYRGFHVFMRALPKILEACPRAHIVIVGGDGVSYGRLPADGTSW